MGLPASTCSNRHCHKWEKIRFCRDTIKFVGLKLTLNGIAPSDIILSAIKDFPKPTDLMNAWSWFWLVNQVVWAYSIRPIMEPILSLVPTAASDLSSWVTKFDCFRFIIQSSSPRHSHKLPTFSAKLITFYEIGFLLGFFIFYKKLVYELLALGTSFVKQLLGPYHLQ